MAKRKRSRGLALPLIAAAGAVVTGEIIRRLYRQSQLFDPSREPVKSWNPADYGIPPAALEEVWIDTPDGQSLYGWYCRAKKPIASILFCHGNTGNLTVSADIIPHLLNAGTNVLFFDYRGFGRSTGRASIKGILADAMTATRFHDQIRPKDLPSILYGFSLGGAVAAEIVQRHPFDGLILQSTFTSLRDITRVLYRRLPLHLLAGKLFNTLSAIKRLKIPLLVLHGSDDELIPCWMAHALHDACASDRKAIHVIDSGLHKDLYVRDADSLVWAINRFVSDTIRRPAQTRMNA